MRALAWRVRAAIGRHHGILPWTRDEVALGQPRLVRRRAKGGVGPYIACGVGGTAQLRQPRPVMGGGGARGPAADQAMPAIDRNMVLRACFGTHRCRAGEEFLVPAGRPTPQGRKSTAGSAQQAFRSRLSLPKVGTARPTCCATSSRGLALENVAVELGAIVPAASA